MSSSLNTAKELITKIRKMRIGGRRHVQTALAGSYHSAFKGKGIEVADLREYVVGDDVRTIDWKVSARTGRPFVKQFCEERELPVILLIDISSSSNFGTAKQNKAELIAEATAMLTLSAIENGDKVGAVFFGKGVEGHLHLGKSPQHALILLQQLLMRQKSSTTTDCTGVFEATNNLFRQGSLLFILSDALFEFPQAAFRIAAKRFDTSFFLVTDPREKTLPDVGIVRINDIESGKEALIDTHNAAFRKQYRQTAKERIANIKRICQRAGAGFAELNTALDCPHTLQAYFASLTKRSQG
ncbi:DUF58 domain-containing protein [Simkania negevensis]|uniref:DUF58 domain-containing protein n=1 Tax=Simkania negevensis TaxID=83561 RepID=A0ABS3AT18_9BACT|nr:DUF58 domain-containing protein [Simkania negevensis]